MSTSNDVCFVCCEKFNKSTNAKITCPVDSCKYEACKKCIRTYITNSSNDPHCMSCKTQWNHKFLLDNLNRSFIDTDYKKYRKTLLTDRAISKTPELMNQVETTKTIEEKTTELNELVKQHAELRKLLAEAKKSIDNKRLEIYRLKSGEDPSTLEKKEFIMPCPSDTCKGYLSTQYKCGICKLYTCPDCHEIIGDCKNHPHQCKEENIQTTRLIKKDTKPCPKCGTRIFKISGCDQMWCTQCHVAFSWNTGRVVMDGNIHNPHYYQWMKENGTNAVPRNPGDQICGGLVAYYQFNSVSRFIRDKLNTPEYFSYLKSNPLFSRFSEKFNVFDLREFSSILTNLHRMVNHISNYEIVTYRNNVRDLLNVDKYTVDYILNKLTREQLSNIIVKNDVNRKKTNDILNVWELLNVVGIEKFNNIYNFYTNIDTLSKKIDSNKVIQFIELITNSINEYNQLICYCNRQLITISHTYDKTVRLLLICNNEDPFIKKLETGQKQKIEYRIRTRKFRKLEAETMTYQEKIINDKLIGSNNDEASSSNS